MRRPARILLVNDDGIHGPGLAPLRSALGRLGEVTCAVPDRECSAESHRLTLRRPLRVRELGRGLFLIDGSPADCARLGVLELMKGRCDLAVSGVNDGYNLGSDTVYSGTVAGALEAAMIGVPALAVSRGWSRRRDFGPAAEIALGLSIEALEKGLPEGVCASVNVPPLPLDRLKGLKVCELGRRLYGKKVVLRRDPQGAAYFWLSGRRVLSRLEPGTDVAAVAEGFVSLTPLHSNHAHRGSFSRLRSWDIPS